MSKDELIAWIVNKQLEIKEKYPVTQEVAMDNQFKKGINEGLRMVWEHIAEDSEHESN